MDRKSTLEKLEKNIWTNNQSDSNLVKRCCELRKIPLNDLAIEDVRLLIGQQIGLIYLVDIAIEMLTLNILSEGDFYPGDLLNSVLSIETNYWMKNEKQWQTIDHLLKKNEDKLVEIKLKTENFYRKKS